MNNDTIKKWAVTGTLTLGFLAHQSFALVKFDQGQDQVFVTGSASVGYDSNIDARRGGRSDVISTASLSVDYARHAGYIGIDANINWEFGQFNDYQNFNFSNPSASVVFEKKHGRTTGTLSLSAARSSSADTVVNIRTESWNYNGVLSWKYPVISRYSLSGDFNYSRIDYQNAGPGIYDLNTYGGGLNINYAYSSQTQLFGGYSILFSDTTAPTHTIDHSFTGGISGILLPKVTGSASAGYSFRQDNSTGQSFSSWTASMSATWKINHFFTMTGVLSKDFSTAADSSSLDSLNSLLTLTYSMTPHWSFFTTAGAGRNRFLTGLSSGRVEDYGTVGGGVTYSLSDHFKASLVYNFYQDWSNQAAADYNIQTLTLNVVSRW